MQKKEEVLSPPAPVVAVTFYAKRTTGNPGYYQGILNEENKNDILRLKDGLEQAANKRGHLRPQVEITLFLIPDWKSGETYDSESYRSAKQQMIADAQKHYGENIIIKDFLDTKASKEELDFILGCESMGSIADIVKTRTIIDNQGRPCLQTDSNVTWADNNFDKLYELTFAANTDAFNTSRCSEVYVSVHNKLVFTGSESTLPQIFERTLVDYCKQYNSVEWHKSASCNGVYDIAFCEGMNQHGLSYRVRVDDKWNEGKTFDFFPAKLQDPRYKLMSLVVPCQRESWRSGMPPPDPAVAELTGQLQLEGGSKKPALEVDINGVKYNYYHFKSLVRVFTNVPSWHVEEAKYKYSGQTHDFFVGAEHARNLFVSQQDIRLSLEVFAQYYNAVKTECEQGRLQTKQDALLVLAKLIPDTEAGNKLSQELFKCSVQELHSNPVRAAIMPEKAQEEYQQLFQVTIKPTYHQEHIEKFKQAVHVVREEHNHYEQKDDDEQTVGCNSLK